MATLCDRVTYISKEKRIRATGISIEKTRAIEMLMSGLFLRQVYFFFHKFMYLHIVIGNPYQTLF